MVCVFHGIPRDIYLHACREQGMWRAVSKGCTVVSYKLQLLPVMSCCLELVGSSPRVSLSQEEESEKRVCTERPRTSNCGRGTPLKSKSGQDEGIITQLLLFAGQGPSTTSCTAASSSAVFRPVFGSFLILACSLSAQSTPTSMLFLSFLA